MDATRRGWYGCAPGRSRSAAPGRRHSAPRGAGLLLALLALASAAACTPAPTADATPAPRTPLVQQGQAAKERQEQIQAERERVLAERQAERERAVEERQAQLSQQAAERQASRTPAPPEPAAPDTSASGSILSAPTLTTTPAAVIAQAAPTATPAPPPPAPTVAPATVAPTASPATALAAATVTRPLVAAAPSQLIPSTGESSGARGATGDPLVTGVPAVPSSVWLPITRVVVARIGLDVDVVQSRLLQRDGGTTWEVPAFKAGHAQQTGGAGAAGNAVLFGHVESVRSGDVFRDLIKVQVGDVVRVYSGTRRFDYRVLEEQAVPRTDVSVLRPTSTASLTLITCMGAWLPSAGDFAERLVVRAELLP